MPACEETLRAAATWRFCGGVRVAAAALVCAVLAGCDGPPPGEGVTEAKRGPFQVTHVEDGELAALNTLTISSRIRGQIEFLAKDLERVEKDAILVELDKSELRNELKRAQDELSSAEKRLAEANRNLEVESGQLEVELERRRAAVRLAEVRLQTVREGTPQADLSIAEKNLATREASLRFAESALADAEALAARGFVSASDLDEKRLARELAFAQVEKARLQLRKLRARPTPAELRSAEFALREAELDLAMSEEQAKSRSASLRQTLEWALAEVSRCRERVRQLEDEISKCTIRAPRAGLVLRARRHWDGEKVDVGGRTWPGIAIVELPDLSSMKVKTQIPESLVRHFNVGDSIYIVANPGERPNGDGAAEERIPGKIIWIDSWARDKNAQLAEADQAREGLSGVRVFSADVALDRTDDRLRLGARVQVVMNLTLPDVVYVDRRAIVMSGGRSYVRALQKGGSERLVPVVLGESNRDAVVVTSGLEPGTRVVLPSGG